MNHTTKIPVFYRKRLSDMSATSEDDDDSWPRSWGFLRRKHEGEGSLPGSLRNRLLALKGSTRNPNQGQTGIPDTHTSDKTILS